MKAAGRGAILVTGASASLRGSAKFGSFGAAKGSLRNMAQALAKELAPEGIHVAHVVVDGGVRETAGWPRQTQQVSAPVSLHAVCASEP